MNKLYVKFTVTKIELNIPNLEISTKCTQYMNAKLMLHGKIDRDDT